MARNDNKTLIIGDVHGHFDRLGALLEQEGIIKDGKRVNDNVNVVQVGDLGHFGSERDPSNPFRANPSSPTGDKFCYERVLLDDWIDQLIWGNHDFAVFSRSNTFGGYVRPPAETKEIMQKLINQGRYMMAGAYHGYLITHAGVHPGFKQIPQVGDYLRTDDPYNFAHFINQAFETTQNHPLWDYVGRKRGGGNQFGGILWRDHEEKLYDGFPQVYGHSASRKGKVRSVDNWDKDKPSYNVDIGGKNEARLAGIYLPSQKIVRVDL